MRDIFSLANADTNEDRCIVFGVSDNPRTIVGVDNDPHRKSQDQLVNWLQSCPISRMPTITLSSEVYEGKTVDILTIRNEPYKPFVLENNYSHAGKPVRAGIYIRNKDTNACAKDYQIEKMYTERWGIDKTPFEKIQPYLKDVDNWKSNHDSEPRFLLHYSPFPEYTLVQSNLDANLKFDEPWIHEFPDNRAFRDIFQLKYHETILKTLYFVSCDGGRFIESFPENVIIDDHITYYFSYYFLIGSVSLLAGFLLREKMQSVLRCPPKRIFSSLSTKELAEKTIREDFSNKKMAFTYYYYSNKKKITVK